MRAEPPITIIDDDVERTDDAREKETPPMDKLPLIDLANGIVGWESQDDPDMPLNWPLHRKWCSAILLSLMTFMTPLSSSILAPAISMIKHDFENTGNILSAFPVSVYLLGYAIGPLLLAGLSELYGRRPVITGSNIFFCLWHIGCALAPSLDSLIGFRFLAGIGGSAVMTLGGSVISDCFPIYERGRALSIWSVGLIVGPAIGPIIGAFIAETVGWRWDFWVVLIPSAITTSLMLVFCPESNHRVLIQRKVTRLRKDSGERKDLRSCYDGLGPQLSHSRILLNGLVRPLKMMIFSPIVVALSTHVAFVYGTLYLLFNSISGVFQKNYGWSLGISGLAYIPIGLGFGTGLVLFAKTSDRAMIRLTRERGLSQPEMRLTTCVWYACVLPVTFFWYGWSAQYKVHWIVPLLGLYPFGIGIVGIWQPYQAYLIDAYGAQYAASSLAAFAVFRSVVAAFLPLASQPMFSSLGIGWGNSLLGFITIAMIPIPIFIERHGVWMRKRFNVAL